MIILSLDSKLLQVLNPLLLFVLLLFMAKSDIKITSSDPHQHVDKIGLFYHVDICGPMHVMKCLLLFCL